jgi:hypothetical protein
MLKKIVLAAAALMIAAPALADGGHRHGHKHGYKHGHYHWKHHHRPVVVMPPPRVYYAPAPRVYYAPPPRVVYAPPRPVYHAPLPASGVSIRLHFPL